MNYKAVDYTDAINTVSSVEKKKALKLISMFDVEYSNDLSLVKHYPLDSTSEINDKEGLIKELGRISEVLWYNVAARIQKELTNIAPVYDPDAGLIKAMPFDERPALPKKIGKIYTCRPNKFGTVGVPVDVVQLYAYGYDNLKENYTEIMAEVNFTVEIY